MLISVVTVSWNAANTIDATCASVDDQTHPYIEHLVIDGQSTDDTLAVVARRPSSQRVVVSGPDDGLYDAMNKGLARARGEVVAFLNADDRYCSRHALAEVNRVFEATGADLVYADIDMVEFSSPIRVQRHWRTGEYEPWRLLTGWQIPHPALFVKRELLARLGGFDASLRIAADYDLMLRLLRLEGVKVQYLPVTLVQMAVGGISTSGLGATWRGYRESARVLSRQFGWRGGLIAAMKPLAKMGQLLTSQPAPAPVFGPWGPAIAPIPRAAELVSSTACGAPPAVASAVEQIRPLHVGKFVPPLFSGGLENHIDTLLRSLPKEMDAALVASEPVFLKAPESEPLPYRLISALSLGTFSSVPLSPGIVRVVDQEFAARRANLLHVHSPNPWGDFAALRAGKDVPVVMTWHSDVIGKRALFVAYQAIQRRAIERANKIIVFTPKHFESSRQLRIPNIESKLVHIPIGVDFDRLDQLTPRPELLESFDEWARGRPVLLSVGRQVHYKGYSHLIKAMSMARHDAVLLMIGTGPLGAQLRRQVRDMRLDHRVRILGRVDMVTLATALRRCDVFCQPSIEQSEAFGIATAEAMGFGKPTIVCELNNGVNFLNRKNETSLVTAPRNEAALADAIDQLVGDAALRARMGQNARQWVRSEFSIDVMREATVALYRALT